VHVKIGISRPEVPPHPTPDVDGSLIAREAEARGFDCVLYGEHTIRPVGQVGMGVHTEGVPQFQDTLVMLARTSALTTTIEFGGGIFLLPQHNPVRFAKELACLDLYGNGRLLVGVGVGWSPLEYEVLGGDFEHRWAQAIEAIDVMRRLWTEPAVQFSGRFFSFPPVQCFPQPKTPGGPPILLAGKSDRALDRVARCAEGWIPSFVTSEAIESSADVVTRGRRRIAALAADHGRLVQHSTTVIIRGPAKRSLVERHANAGTDRLTFSLPQVTTLDEARRALDQIGSQVLRG
jgi:probable F420-dependent oxidoreductase